MTDAMKTLTFSIKADQYVEIFRAGWTGYKAVMRARGEKGRPKMIYLDGDLLLISTSLSHERLNARLSFFVTQLVVELNIPCDSTGQTSLFRRKKAAGIEADGSYYLAHEAEIRENEEIDLRVDPPPDLAIQVVRDFAASKARAVFRRLRVPEVWIFNDDGLCILILGPDRKYAESSRSMAFPFLTSTEILEWVQRPVTDSHTRWMRDFRDWVRETLVPRVQGPLNI